MLVEAAIVLPVLLLVVFGIIEFGFAFRDAQTAASATRTGARVGVTLARRPEYLTSVTSAVKTALENALKDDQIDYLTVYKASSTSGNPVGGSFENCTTDCSRYTFSGGNWVQVGGLGWTPTDMKACGSIGHTDYLGVYVKIHHQNFTPLFGNTLTMRDHTVMRLEPVVTDAVVTSCE